jgi:hypothetical protein
LEELLIFVTPHVLKERTQALSALQEKKDGEQHLSFPWRGKK